MIEKELKWFRMDNSAKLYPVMTTLNSQSLYRVSVVLKNKVEEEPLQQALTEVLGRFPTFNVRIRRGVFWYYFEENIKPPVVVPDSGILMEKINQFKTHDFLFRVSCFGPKISIDFFHAVTDGAGALEFSKALAAKYLTLTGKPSDLKIFHTEPSAEEAEDSFAKYYDPKKSIKLDIKEFTGQKSYKVKGEWFRGLGYGLIQANMPVKQVLTIAKSYGCSMTVLLVSLAMKSIAESDKEIKLPITIMVPVNLRKLFPSKTLLNFVLFVSLRVLPKPEYTLEDYIALNKEQLERLTTKEELQKKINISVKGLKMPLLRFMPLPIKYLAIKFGRLFVKGGSQTMIFSNLGIWDTEGLDIEYACVNMNASRNSAVNMSMLTCGEKLIMCSTRAIKSAQIELEFFRSLAKMGVDIEVYSNFREDVPEGYLQRLRKKAMRSFSAEDKSAGGVLPQAEKTESTGKTTQVEKASSAAKTVSAEKAAQAREAAPKADEIVKPDAASEEVGSQATATEKAEREGDK